MSTLPRTLSEAALCCGAELRGPPSLAVSGVAGLVEADSTQISFFTNRRYRSKLASTRAAAIIVSEADASLPELEGRALLVSGVPYAAFARLSQAFYPPAPHVPGIDPMARVEPGALLDPTVRVDAFAYVARGARLGARVHVQTGAYIGEDTVIGDDTQIHPRVVIRERCIIGARCVLQAGAVIGSDGFGFAFDPEGAVPVHRKVPQVGIVRIDDEVEIGANSCVDRATLGETHIGRGVKIDNLVQIAHNVKVGPLSVLAAQVGIAGSSTLGAGVQMGGQSGVVGHIEVGDRVKLGAKSGAAQSVPAGSTQHGYPSMDAPVWLRSSALLARLPELFRDLKSLARRVKALETKESCTD